MTEKTLYILAAILAIFPILSIILNTCNIPLYYLIFLGLIFIGVGLAFYYNKIPKFKFDYHLIGACIFGCILISVYLFGAFSYEWLENDDPPAHAAAAKYVGEEYTYTKSFDINNFKRSYLEPYTPSYSIFMGMMYQGFGLTITQTLKIFNSILCGLMIIFFYLFAKESFKDKNKALLATFILVCLPSFASHFIWSQTLAILLIIIILYFFMRKDYYLASIGIASLFVTQPSSAAIFIVMFVTMFIMDLLYNLINYKKEKGYYNIFGTNIINWNYIMCGFVGVLLSLIYWIPNLIKHGWEITKIGIGLSKGFFTSDTVDTSAGIIYKLSDFLIAPMSSKIDQATGWGIFVFCLVIFGLFMLIKNYKKLEKIHYIILGLFFVCFIGVQGNALPIKLFPHRFFIFLAIPVALLCAESIMIIINSIDKKTIIDKLKIGTILTVLIIGIILTSAVPKWTVQTAQWPPGLGFSSHEELDSYIWMKDNLTEGTRVFNICRDEEKVIAFSMDAPIYDLYIDEFRRNEIKDLSVEKLISRINYFCYIHNFNYIVADVTCIKYITQEKYIQLLNTFYNNNKIFYQKEHHFVMFEVDNKYKLNLDEIEYEKIFKEEIWKEFESEKRK